MLNQFPTVANDEIKVAHSTHPERLSATNRLAEQGPGRRARHRDPSLHALLAGKEKHEGGAAVGCL